LHTIFLSYASEDAKAAQRICEALRAASIEVFLDQSELRGGDAWDRKIRDEIHACALFIPIVSQNTQQRLEGYFRHEWHLAVERTHHMAQQKPFVLPVVIDSTGEAEAFVPDLFRMLPWTRLNEVEIPSAFIDKVKAMLYPDLSALTQSAHPAKVRKPLRPHGRPSLMTLSAITAVAVVLSGVSYLVVDSFRRSKHSAASVSPPAHSVAVLPFVNMSGDKDQDYLSDGLTDELLNSLAEINELQVAARTSAFFYKDKDIDIGTIGRQLNVASILEGSVRRSGNTVRITTQLIDPATGFRLWSHTYDRNLEDILKLETEIAGAVATALRVSLLGDVATKIELGGTRIPAAFDAYLRARKLMLEARDVSTFQNTIAAYSEAIGADPNFAVALAGRSLAYSSYAEDAATGPDVRAALDKAQADAREAIAMAPALPEGHVALARFCENGSLDFAQASDEYDRAAELAPNEAFLLEEYGRFAVWMGHNEAGIAAAQRAIVADPLNPISHSHLGQALYHARQYREAIAAYDNYRRLFPNAASAYSGAGLAYYALSDFEHARPLCESKPDYWQSPQCLAVILNKTGRRVDALAIVKKMLLHDGDNAAYQFAEIFAQFNDKPKAIAWLEKAMRLRDAGLVQMKSDPLMDPLRDEPYFRAAMQQLKFPK
jgi:TolB-like protein